MNGSQPLCPNGAGPTSRGHADFEPLADGVLRCLSCRMLAKKIFPDRPVWVHAHTFDRLIDLENETKQAGERFKRLRRGKESAKHRPRPFPDPFEILGLPREDAKGRFTTRSQCMTLKRSGIDGEGLRYDEANRLILELERRQRVGLAAYFQVKLLRPYGYSPMTTLAEATGQSKA